MQSCDTLSLCAKYSRFGQNMFAKNSDRPTAETQLLCAYPAKKYETGATVKLTDLEIPQVESTYATVGSRPYWTWGFEMGYNEKGLIIGNEAQGSKNAAETETGILGMDLLRLGLERAATAREAISVITELLEKYGQNANASQLFDRRYENSYMLVDKNEIWLLETAGREWVARQIKDMLGISNCYSTEKEFDIASPTLESRAREMRWLSPDEKFNFAKAYTLPADRQTFALPRMRRLNKLLAKSDSHDYSTIRSILRDHFDGEINESRFGVCMGNFNSICMHSRVWTDSETTAGIISRIDNELGVISRYSIGQPCLSVFMPIYDTGYIPEKISFGGKYFDEASLWWKIKRVGLLVCVDEERFAKRLHTHTRVLEEKLWSEAEEAEGLARKYISEGKKDEAYKLLNSLMDSSCARIEDIFDNLYTEFSKEISELGGIYGIHKHDIEKYCDYAEIPLL